MVRSVTYREPEFSGEDVALALASDMLESERGPHGVLMSEATDPKNRDAFVSGETPATDFAAKAMRDAKDKYYKRYPAADADRDVHVWRGVSRR